MISLNKEFNDINIDFIIDELSKDDYELSSVNLEEIIIDDEFKKVPSSKRENNESNVKKPSKSGVKITSIHKGHRERMLTKFIKHGISSFSDFEVLEFLLFYAIPYKDTNEIAHKLIDKFGSIKAVMEADHQSLVSVDGIGDRSAALIVLFREFHKYISITHYSQDILYTSKISAEYCMKYFANHVEESFIVISLDSERRVKCIDVISEGNESETAFYPRNIIKVVLKNRATNVILAHNHPDNNPEPSSNDLALTDQITYMLKGLGAVVIDHIICSGNGYYSFADKGYIKG